MLTDLLWLQLAPTAQATIGWQYYIVFIVLTTVHAVYFWFYLPDVSPLTFLSHASPRPSRIVIC